MASPATSHGAVLRSQRICPTGTLSCEHRLPHTLRVCGTSEKSLAASCNVSSTPARCPHPTLRDRGQAPRAHPPRGGPHPCSPCASHGFMSAGDSVLTHPCSSLLENEPVGQLPEERDLPSLERVGCVPEQARQHTSTPSLLRPHAQTPPVARRTTKGVSRHCRCSACRCTCQRKAREKDREG